MGKRKGVFPPHAYHWVRAWGVVTGQREEQIITTQQEASLTEAPLDAAYWVDATFTKRWVTVGQVLGPEMRTALTAYAKNHDLPPPNWED